MIKDTFYNLPREKINRIIEAAQKELVTSPIHNAKVSNIIRDAGIPRGSFYQYFDTINDVFNAVLKEIEKNKQSDFISFLIKNNGDLFVSANEMFISEYEYFFKYKESHLIGNLLNITKFDNNIEIQKNNSVINQLVSKIDLTDLNIENQSLHSLLILLFITISENVRLSVTNSQDKQEAVKSFTQQLNFIMHGAKKTQK